MASERARPGDAGGYICAAALRWADGQTQFTSAVTRSLLRFVASKTDEFGVSWHAQRTLSEETGYGERTVRNHLRLLEDAGVLRTIRRCRGGMRVTNACHLIGWPGRKRLPDSGHPVLGRHVVEDAISSLGLVEYRHALPLDAESAAALNKDKEKKEEDAAEKVAILDRCLQSLGHWGTQKNCRALIRSSESLLELLRQGYNLHRHVLPAIETTVRSRRRIPRLDSWAFFGDAIARRAALEAHDVAPCENVSWADRLAEGGRSDAPRAGGAGDDPEIKRYLEELGGRKRVGRGGGDE